MATDSPLAAVQRYIDAFNDGDIASMTATFAETAVILDGMAPHLWQGETAASDWYSDVLVEGELHGASGYFVSLGEAVHNNITGDNAYVVLPATMTFDVDGRRITQTGAFFTVALQRRSKDWRIAAWAWTKGNQ